MHVLVYTTASGKEEAEKIAELLINEKLAACVNYFPINTLYHWKGELVKDTEYLLLSKSTKEKFKKLKQALAEIHSYEIPAITCIPIQDGHQPFLDWINEEVGKT